MNHKIYSNKTFQLKAKDIAFDSVFNLFPINFCWMDKDGYFLGCNKKFMDSVNIQSFSDIIGKHTTEIASEMAWENTKKVIQTGESITVEEIHLNKEFKTTYFLSMKNPMKDCSGKVIGVVNIAIDITERKSMEMNLRALKEAAELADKVKTDFLKNMRHDLRTPLTGILSISEFLQNEESESTKKNYLLDIKHCAESMLNHLNEIVDHVKAETGEFSVLEKEFNIYNVLNDVYQMMMPVANSKKIAFTLVLSHLPADLIGDAARTQRIIMNVVSNAIKFTEKGFVEVKAIWIPISVQEGILQLIVEDSGIGIPSDKQNIVFEKFHRLHPSYEGIYKGDGLGLNIVKQFLEEIGGHYELKSEVGKGTIFKIQIPYKLPPSHLLLHEVLKMYAPLTTADISVPTENLSIKGDLTIKTEKKKILLVEDNDIISRISKDILEAFDLEVDIAETGQKAISLLDRQYSLIIMDIGLPDISGYDVARVIRAHNNPIISKIPIFAVTAHSEEEEKVLAIDAGMNDMFPKPLNQEMAKFFKAQVS